MSTWKDFYQNAQCWKWICYRTIRYAVFSPDILQAVAVRGSLRCNPPVENRRATEGSFKVRSRSDYIHVCFTHCQEFLPCYNVYTFPTNSTSLFSVLRLQSICLVSSWGDPLLFAGRKNPRTNWHLTKSTSVCVITLVCKVPLSFVTLPWPKQTQQRIACWWLLNHTRQGQHSNVRIAGYSCENQLRSMLLYVHRNHQAYKGRWAQDGHLDFHTALSSEPAPVNMMLNVHRNQAPAN